MLIKVINDDNDNLKEVKYKQISYPASIEPIPYSQILLTLPLVILKSNLN